MFFDVEILGWKSPKMSQNTSQVDLKREHDTEHFETHGDLKITHFDAGWERYSSQTTVDYPVKKPPNVDEISCLEIWETPKFLHF